MALTLLASAARTASNVAVLAIPNLQTIRGGVFLLNVSEAALLVDDTLDVYLQGSVDGINYNDFIHFTQVLGNGGAKVYEAKWLLDIAPETELGAPSDKAMGAGVLQGPQAISYWRLAWVIVGGSSKSFTFSVAADLLR